MTPDERAIVRAIPAEEVGLHSLQPATWFRKVRKRVRRDHVSGQDKSDGFD